MLQYDYDVVVLHSELRVSQVIDDIEVLLGIIVQPITAFTMSIETGGLQRGVSDKDYNYESRYKQSILLLLTLRKAILPGTDYSEAIKPIPQLRHPRSSYTPVVF
jgi:hypothetical protein